MEQGIKIEEGFAPSIIFDEVVSCPKRHDRHMGLGEADQAIHDPVDRAIAPHRIDGYFLLMLGKIFFQEGGVIALRGREMDFIVQSLKGFE